MHETDVVIIGAGAAGVAAARQLLAAQIPAVVLEARARVGGRAWTLREPSGLALDLGCGWLHSADENEWAALAPALGLTVDQTPPPWGGRRRTIGFPSAEQEDFGAASERFFARIDAAAEDPVDRPAA
ncbi:MAG TPA: FAD-dependent oxidoreductase, partial [Xanthobacteraceae bacterium]